MRSFAPFIALVVSLFIGFTAKAEDTFDVEVYRATGWDQTTCQTRFGSHYWDPNFGEGGACLCHPDAFPLYEARVDACLSVDTWLDYQATFELGSPSELPTCSRSESVSGTEPGSTSTNSAVTGPNCRDCDGDGYSFEHDCDDWSYAIYPGAPEVAGNGVDEDCDGEDQEKDRGGFHSKPPPASDTKAESEPELEPVPAEEKVAESRQEDAGEEPEPEPATRGPNLLEKTGLDVSFQNLDADQYTVGPGQMREYGGFKMRTASGTDNVYVTDEDGNHILELMVGRDREEQPALNAVFQIPNLELESGVNYRLYFHYRTLQDCPVELAIAPAGTEPTSADRIHETELSASPSNWHGYGFTFDVSTSGNYDLSLGWANVKELLVLDRFSLHQM